MRATYPDNIYDDSAYPCSPIRPRGVSRAYGRASRYHPERPFEESYRHRDKISHEKNYASYKEPSYDEHSKHYSHMLPHPDFAKKYHKHDSSSSHYGKEHSYDKSSSYYYQKHDYHKQVDDYEMVYKTRKRRRPTEEDNYVYHRYERPSERSYRGHRDSHLSRGSARPTSNDKRTIVVRENGDFEIKKGTNESTFDTEEDNEQEYESVLCPNYGWDAHRFCTEDGCTHLHICKFWLGGACSNESCPLSHSLHDKHNYAIIQDWVEQDEEFLAKRKKIGDNDIEINNYLREWLVEKLPKLCTASLSAVKRCEDNNCSNLHLCLNLVKKSYCSFPTCAAVSHEVFSRHNRKVLREHFPQIPNFSRRPVKEQTWLADVIRNDSEKAASNAESVVKKHYRLYGLTIEQVQMCPNYGEGRPECNNANCDYLHICRSWLAGHCQQGEKCNWLHGFTKEALDIIGRCVKDKSQLNCEYNIRDNLALLFPKSCLFYNVPDSRHSKCQRADDECDFVHLCVNKLRGVACVCSRNHDPYKSHVLRHLRRCRIHSHDDDMVMLKDVIIAEQGRGHYKWCPQCNCHRVC